MTQTSKAWFACSASSRLLIPWVVAKRLLTTVVKRRAIRFAADICDSDNSVSSFSLSIFNWNFKKQSNTFVENSSLGFHNFWGPSGEALHISSKQSTKMSSNKNSSFAISLVCSLSIFCATWTWETHLSAANPRVMPWHLTILPQPLADSIQYFSLLGHFARL